ncbi:MAG: CHASE2 domain-containing protein [Xenococcaceae cyanobacterium]
MLSKLQNKIKLWQGVLISAPVCASFVIGAKLLGALQGLELNALDKFFLYRPQELVDSRITIVGISDTDIDRLGKWPLDDATLAKAIETISSQKPAAIGIDLYRNLPVEPGHQKLVRVFETTPNLIGIEKAIGDRVASPPTLAAGDRVGMADLILDPDGKIRRAIIASQEEDGQMKLGLATRLALIYLENKNISLESVANTNNQKLGKALFVPITGKDGGYRNIDWGGYQILLNYRGSGKAFKIVSIWDLLAGKIPADLLRDRVVLIGSVAPSLNDYFYTPLSNSGQASVARMAGIVVHANIASQIIDAALGERPMLHSINDNWEFISIFCCSLGGAIIGFLTLQRNTRHKNFFSSIQWGFLGIIFPVGILTCSGYILFLNGWWMPIAAPMLAWTGAAVLSSAYYTHQKQQLVFVDSLTQIGNRYSFDRFLERQWLHGKQEGKSLALILCDVDYFKPYNDTYGHQGGDECLKQVAKAIAQVIRTSDLVARYGGEEFAIVLPDTDATTAVQIAQRILVRIRDLQLPHLSSQIGDCVSISCGVACSIPNDTSSPKNLIETADRALYNAKKQGRDRAVFADI